MASKKDTPRDPEKTVDLPPTGSRNPDPITDAPGSHPIETGIGAAIGGVASGAAVGAVGGPIGAIVGGIVGGAIAGGYAGKGVGELIDPTTEDNWIREYIGNEKDKPAGATVDTYRPAYQYGMQAATAHTGKRFEDVETDLRSGWEKSSAQSGMAWDQARGAARHAFDRTVRLHEERLKVDKERVQTGDVKVRTEVRTERQTVTVPVEKEEVVIEHHPVHGAASSGEVKAQEIRIPVREEKVHVGKETVVKEEVTIGKRKVQDTETVSADVRKEELKVEQQGDARVREKRD